uniref:RING-type domain-containing protein n=1 Tax=Heterorhabditis bacteriophora TaxID=37862 RepID=A0A1I7WK40_HETBA
MDFARIDLRNHQEQMHESLKVMKIVAIRVLETALRLPGLILLELWWRNRDISFEEITQEMLNKAPFNSYLDISTILDFVHRRNFDHSAALILSYSAHNVACSMVMLFICIYVLNRVPDMVQGLRTTFRQVKAIFVIRGLAGGCVTVWRRLRIAELMTCAWLTMFFIRMYIEMLEKGRSWREAGPALLSGIAESTNTPISLLALALTVSFVCKWIVDGAQMAIGGRRDHGHVLAHSGYTEALTLVLLCAQTGLLGMKTELKAFLLGLVLFIVMSALLQSLYELLEPQLLSLAASASASRGRHFRCLTLAFILLIAPVIMAFAITAFLPIDLWCVILCVIIVSNCILTAVHAASSTVQYIIGMIESRAVEPWERSDDLLFAARTITKVIELIVALIVVVYGIYFTFTGNWTLATLAVLVFHIIFNVYRRMEILLGSISARRAAVKNISRLPRASKEELSAHGDVCAICFMEMWEEARVTPCNHFFHGACLRKWLSVKQMSFNITGSFRIRSTVFTAFSNLATVSCSSHPAVASKKKSNLKERMDQLQHIPDFPYSTDYTKCIYDYICQNTLQVKLRPPPWTRRWELFNYKGIEDSWTQATPWFKRKLHKTKVSVQSIFFPLLCCIFLKIIDIVFLRCGKIMDTCNILFKTIIAHSSCGQSCARAIPVELWTIRLQKDVEKNGLAPLFLKNAIRSHLHFSQLNSWIASREGCLAEGYLCTYRLVSRPKFPANSKYSVADHTFPVCRLNRNTVVIVSVDYIKHNEIPLPVGLCLNLSRFTIIIFYGNEMRRLKHKSLPAFSPDGPAPKFPAITNNKDDQKPIPRTPPIFRISQRTINEENDVDHLAKFMQQTHTISDKGRGRQRTKSGGTLGFNKVTGLPLHSSPAPLARQRNLSASEIVLPDQRLSRGSHPGSLLGNFEESALNGRLDPVTRLDGFTLQLAASGSFTSPHVSLPVSTYVFDLNNDSDNTPTPFLGTCSLDYLGKKKYRVPKEGTIQATLFNPQGTVVKVFVASYEMSDMPPSSQTFLRQRTFLKRQEDTQIDKHLVHLIHLRLATDRRCRIYLHTDVRILFSQNSTLDGLNMEVKGKVGMGSDRYRLVTETEMPRHPRYSPKK